MHNEFFIYSNFILFDNGTAFELSEEFLFRQPTDMDFEKLCDIYNCQSVMKQCKRKLHLQSGCSYNFKFQDIQAKKENVTRNCTWTFTTDDKSTVIFDFTNSLEFCLNNSRWIESVNGKNQDKQRIVDLCRSTIYNSAIHSTKMSTSIDFVVNYEISRYGFQFGVTSKFSGNNDGNNNNNNNANQPPQHAPQGMLAN